MPTRVMWMIVFQRAPQSPLSHPMGLAVLWALLPMVFLLGCGSKKETGPGIDAAGVDAYAAARIMVEKSIAVPGAARISQWENDPTAGVREQADGSWKTWGWLEMTGPEGEVIHREWRAVMRRLGSEGRRWQALWLKVGEEQSGDPTTWSREP